MRTFPWLCHKYPITMWLKCGGLTPIQSSQEMSTHMLMYYVIKEHDLFQSNQKVFLLFMHLLTFEQLINTIVTCNTVAKDSHEGALYIYIYIYLAKM